MFAILVVASMLENQYFHRRYVSLVPGTIEDWYDDITTDAIMGVQQHHRILRQGCTGVRDLSQVVAPEQ